MGTATPAAATDAADPVLPDDVADVVLGQPGMTYPFANRTDARGLIHPSAVAVDTSVQPYRLYVIDSGNHRVLGYAAPLSADRPVAADLVLGQPNLLSGYFHEGEAGPTRLLAPAGITVDTRGNVYVSDSGYHRVLEFNQPFETDAVADRVFGQDGSFESFEANRGGISAGSLAFPQGICIDPRTGVLWVADTGNHRVLGYLSPLSTDRLADVVLGQPDFSTAQANAGGIGPDTLHAPTDVAVTDGSVVVSDTGNRRVLVYEAPMTTDGIADHVLGQDGSFEAAESGCSPFRFAGPTGLAVEGVGGDGPRGRLLVSDTPNHRLLMFAPPGSPYRQPIGLWGQKNNLHTGRPNFGGLGPASLYEPRGIALAPDGTLWVADSANHRVLGFDHAARGDRAADHVIGQIDLVHRTANFVDGSGFSGPRDVALDPSVRPPRFYVCDTYNNRIVGYASAVELHPASVPDLVIGQPDVYANDARAGRAGLSSPVAIAVDANGGLFVADRENNRVLWFDRPFETDTLADRVFGQDDFTSGAPNPGGISARSLNRPEGVAVDRAGNLYVADTRNHRILRFDRAVQTDAVADAVWGQGGSFTRGKEYGGAGIRADTFSYPFGLAIRADGLLAVADTNNHRVLLFNTRGEEPFRAIRVFGQSGDFTRARDNFGGCSARSLSGPEGVAFWQKGLFVADTANCRVLWYNDIRSRDDRADAVYGQFGSFRTNRRGMGATGARNLWFPSGIEVDASGNLYVADREQSRILVFRNRDSAATSTAPAHPAGIPGRP